MDEAKERDYKAEYKKFQSSTKSKKYRAELNKYNRKKGTYGNGDGKDASHKGGKIVGFESQSKNRGRAEKSRLKQESLIYEIPSSVFSAAAAVKLKNKDGKEVSAATAAKSDYAKKDPSTHKKAKSIFQRLKDKFSKKKDAKPKKQSKSDADFYKRQYAGESVKEAKKKIKIKGKWKHNKLPWMRGPKNEAGTKSIDGIELLTFLMKRFNYSKKKAIDVMKKNKMDTSFLKNESDLGLTYKKGKTVKVKHKTSGKSLVIIDKPNVRKEYEKIGYYAESVNEGTTQMFSSSKIDKAIKIAKSMGGNMTGAVKKIEKIEKNLSKNGRVEYALQQANESVNEAEKWKTIGIDVRDIYDYMVSIKKTNPAKFKKDMKNRALKGIWDRYSKGGEMYKESVNEAENKIADIRKILKTKKGKRIDSIFMDVETAEKVIKHYKSLKGSAKEKFVKQKIQNIVKSVKESINEAQNKIADIRKILKTKKGKRIDSIFMDVETAAAINKKYKSLGKHQRQKFITQKIQNIVKSVKESVNEAKFSTEMVNQAVGIAFHYRDNMTKAVKAIEKMKKGLSKDKTVAYALQTANESVNEVQKRQATDIAVKFDKAYLNFSREIRDIIKMVVKITGNRTDGKIFEKSYTKHLIPFDALFKSWYKGQQNNPHIKESVNEAKSKTMKTIGSIIGKKQAQKISGVLVDMQTALVIMKVWNALGSSNRAKFEKLPIKQMAAVAWKLMK